MRVILNSIVSLSVLLQVACANPLFQADAERAAEACSREEINGHLELAEQACTRALDAVRSGKHSATEQSEKLYNLARIERQLGRFDAAAVHDRESLAIEDRQAYPSNERTGRRLAELAMLYAQQRDIETGLTYVDRLYALPDIYAGRERNLVATIFYLYGLKLRQSGQQAYAQQLVDKALQMGFDPKTLEQ